MATAAAASQPTSTTASLSVLGADSDGGGESNLTYTWSATGPTAVSYSANATNAAKNTTATFTKAGSYQFTVTITDQGGLSTTSSVSVTVNQTLTSIAVGPATASLVSRGTVQLAALANDQFGAAMSVQPTFTWAVASGGGSVSSSGLYTAPYVSGSATVAAASGAVTSNAAAVTITDAAPTVATAAAASPSAPSSTTAGLSVLGADSDGGGEGNLTYAWSSTGPAAVSYSANGTNAAKNTTAIFTKAGSYQFTATINDAGGLSTTSSVNVTVSQSLQSIAVSPSTVSISVGAE